MINIGILGAGRIGKVHVKSLKQISGVYIKSIADPYLDEAWAKTQNIKNCYKSTDDILNDDEIDAVYICTPTDTHADLIIQAARKNKAIFCEKPVDINLNRILEVSKVLKETKVLCHLGFNRRFDTSFSKLAKEVEDKTLGDIISIKIISRDCAAPPKEYVKTSGGMFLDMTIHDFDMLRFISKKEVKEVFVKGGSFVSSYGDIDIDTAMIHLELEDKSLALIENCRATTFGYDQRIEVFGTKAQGKCENILENSFELTNDNGNTQAKALDFFLERYEQAYFKESQAFVENILDKRKNLGAKINDCLEATFIALACKKSLEEKRAVTIDEIKRTIK